MYSYVIPLGRRHLDRRVRYSSKSLVCEIHPASLWRPGRNKSEIFKPRKTQKQSELIVILLEALAVVFVVSFRILPVFSLPEALDITVVYLRLLTLI